MRRCSFKAAMEGAPLTEFGVNGKVSIEICSNCIKEHRMMAATKARAEKEREDLHHRILYQLMGSDRRSSWIAHPCIQEDISKRIYKEKWLDKVYNDFKRFIKLRK